jgi:hypothetical protein
VSPKVKDSCYDHKAVDRGGDKPKDAQSEQKMKHGDTVHLILNQLLVRLLPAANVCYARCHSQ